MLVWIRMRRNTFRNGKEANGCNCVPVSTSDSVVRVANGQIERVVLYMPGRHSDCSFVAPKDNWAVHCSFGSWVRFKDIVLYVIS